MFSDTTTTLIWISIIVTVLIAELKWLEEKYHKLRTLLLVCTSIFTLWLTSQNEQKKDLEQKKEKKINDSIAQARINAAVGEVSDKFGKAVGQYNLRVDSGFDGVIKMVRDSAKRVYSLIKEDDPYFGLCIPDTSSIKFEKVDNRKTLVKMNFCSYKSTSRNIYLNLAFIIASKEGYKIVTEVAFTNTDVREDALTQLRREITITNSINDNIYVYMYGSYTNSSNSKHFIVNKLSIMNVVTNDSPISSISEIKEIKSFLHSNKVVGDFLKKNKIEVMW